MAKGGSELPHNTEAEKAVLGSMLLSTESLYNAMSSLEQDDYFEGRHQVIYKAIKDLMDRKHPVDALTVAEELDNMKELENIGGVDYLRELTESMISLANLQFYIDIISDQSVMRKMLVTIREIDRKYREEDIDNPNDFILTSEADFKESVAKRHISSFIDAKTAAKRVEAQLQDQQGLPEDDDVTGFNTGYPGINFYTQGFQRGEMVIVAARPSVGKTALATNFAYQVATKCNATVAIFSLEMTADSLIKRLVASVSCVPLKHISTGHFFGQERAKVGAALNEVGNTKIFIDDTNGIRLMDIIAKSRKLQAANPDLGLIVIDYLGLVQIGGTSKGPDSRQEEVRRISLALKGLAKDLKVPVIVVSQLSRDVEKRDTKKPMLSDLRDSGSIEQDADVVMLLYRDDYYGEQKKTDAANKKGGRLSEADKFALAKAQKEKELGSSIPGNASFVEVNIAKNRNGATGKVPLFFYKDYGRFDSPTQEWIDAMKEIEQDDASD